VKCIFIVLFVSVGSDSNLDIWTASPCNLAHTANTIAGGRHAVSRRVVRLCG